MNIEDLIGVEVESVDGTVIGEIVGIELYGSKIHVIIASEFDFDDGNGGIPVEIGESNTPNLKLVEKNENILPFTEKR